MPKESNPPAVFLMGPTASGKSKLAVQLAQALNGEIISVDSALVYRGMDIGTAKPTIEERQGIPHHLIDILDPAESFSTGQFRTQALRLIDDITQRGRLPILAGGTMLYFRALTQGIAELPEADSVVRAKLDEELKNLGKAAMHERLKAIDPAAAARIHPNDPQRIQRALEVFELTGIPLSDYFVNPHELLPYRYHKIILLPENRKILHERIAQRFVNMVDAGLIEEVRKLFQRGDLSEALPSIRCVGYRQIWMYLKGEVDYKTMIEKGIIATRQLAKRQFTWLRKEHDALHFQADQPNLLEQVSAVIQQQMM